MKKDINLLIKDKDSQNLYNLSQNLLQTIYNARAALTKLGVIRSNKLAGADYTEWLVSILTGAEINPNKSKNGYDLEIKKNSKKIEVKSRMVNDINKFTDFHISAEPDKQSFICDELYCVLLNHKYEILLIMKIDFKNGAFNRLKEHELIKLNDKQKENRFTISWNKSRKNKLIEFSKNNSDVIEILYLT